MGFKSDTKAPVRPQRQRNHDPVLEREAMKLVEGKVTRILATGDESTSVNTAKGKQSDREKSARSEAGRIANYIRSKFPEFGDVQTIWLRPDHEDGPAVQIARKVVGEVDANGNAVSNGNGNG